MAGSLLYITAAIFTVVALFLYIKNSIDRSSFKSTPTIPIEKVTITSYASSTILAKPEKVFEVLMKYEEYAEWSTFKDFKWRDTTEDGIPIVGTKGTFLFHIEGFSLHPLHAVLTALDREKMIIAERTAGYPRWLLSTERVQQVVSIEGHKDLCEYRTWQSFQGIASYFLVFIAREELAESLRTTANGLKNFVEK